MAGTLRALVTNTQAGGVRQGGSSITQQLAKNLFLTNERTLERKIKEAFLALWLESRLTKNEILKLYLDRAYLGGGAFGVDAAAQFYFNKSARDVNLAESAMLAGMFKAPTKFAPHINLPAARARANVVLDNLVESGMMTEGQVFGARRNPAMALDRRDDRAPNYFLDYAFDEMKKLVSTFPKSMNERVFLVRTSLDSGLQRVADDSVENLLKQYGRDYHASQSALVVADLDGGVRAMVGGRDYTSSQFNRATDALRQPGSSFKPYVYATALEHGMTPNLDRGRRSGLHRQLVPAQLLRRLQRIDAAGRRVETLDQHRCSKTHRSRSAKATPRWAAPRSSRMQRQWGFARRCPTRPRSRSAPTR